MIFGPGMQQNVFSDTKNTSDGPVRAQGIVVRIAGLALAAVMLFGGGALAGETATGEAATDAQVAYRTGPGDKLRVTVFGHEDLSGEFQVDGTGKIALPLVGNVDAGDKTADELEAAIVAKLKPDYLKNPRVNVEILNYRPFYILGEVKSPGSYPYVNGMTVVNAIALSGGYTYRGNQNKVAIIRADDPERKKQPANHDTLVLPGDVIEVPERFF